MRDKGEKWHWLGRIGWVAIVNATIILSVLAVLEVYLRNRESHIIAQDATWLQRLVVVTGDIPDPLILNSPNGKRLQPDAHVIIRNHYLTKRDIIFDTNSMGFRDDEIPKIKMEGDFRILVLGDSIACANYIQAGETYIERMEEYLNEKTEDLHFEAINAGVPDIGIREEIDILEDKGLSCDPDVVLLAFYLNDSRPPWGFQGELGRYGFLRRHSILARKIYGNLVLRKWIDIEGKNRVRWIGAVEKLPWRNDREAFLQLAYLAEYDWGSSWKEDSWQVVESELRRLKTNQDKHGFEVVVVAFPVSYQVYSDFIEATPQKQMMEKAAMLGFHYFDLLPVLREHGKDIDLFYDHCHPTSQANDIIGKEIAEFLDRAVLEAT